MMCSKCNSTGWLDEPTQFNSVKRCVCYWIQDCRDQIDASLGEDIRMAAAMLQERCPLVEWVSTDDKTGYWVPKSKKLLITSTWAKMQSALKTVAVLQHHQEKGVSVLLTSDVKIKERHYQETTEAKEAPQGLHTWLESKRILVVRLIQRTEVKTLADVLWEALQEKKTVWLWTDVSKPFGKSHRAWNEGFGAWVDENFDRVKFGDELPARLEDV